MSLACRSQNNKRPRDGNSKRSVVLNPLPGRAQAAHVEEILTQKGTPAGRKENAVGLHDVALRANDVLRNRVDDQAALLRQHQRDGQTAGDDVRPRAHVDHGPGRLLPERAAELAHVLVAAPDVVDQHVEPAVLVPHAVEARLDARPVVRGRG